MAELVHKKRVRGGHKASVTVMITMVEETLAVDPIDTAKLTKLKMSLQDKIPVLNRLDEDVLGLLETDVAVADDITQSDTFKGDIYAAIVNIDQHISARSPPDPSLVSRPAAGASTMKLPKLTIQPFNGEPTRWTTFWDIYSIFIINSWKHRPI